jgi:CheY-like chemotaxis protein
MMPGVDGFGVLDRARLCVPALPVIVMSAVDLKARRPDVFRGDHTLFLRKPFDIETLLTGIERLVGSPSN